MTEQVNYQTEIAKLWSALELINARIETPVIHGAPGPALTAAQVNAIANDARSEARISRMASDTVWEAYARLFLVAKAVRENLSRECDHAYYQGSPAAVDDLEAELTFARKMYGAVLATQADRQECEP